MYADYEVRILPQANQAIIQNVDLIKNEYK